MRERAIQNEAFRLLQVLTTNPLRLPEGNLSGDAHDWFLVHTQSHSTETVLRRVYGQKSYPSFATDQPGQFWDGEADEIPQVAAQEYFDHVGIGRDDTFALPDDLDSKLDCYFSLQQKRKITFARACKLFGVGLEVWPSSRSLSLVSFCFAVDALCHVDDPKPDKCPKCQNLISRETCPKCHGPTFRITQRFKDFIKRFVSGPDLKVAEQLFSVRSTIAHVGRLLRADDFDYWFTTGGSDDQHQFNYETGRIVRTVMRGWLSESGDSGSKN
jgi:hypothetical protein